MIQQRGIIVFHLETELAHGFGALASDGIHAHDVRVAFAVAVNRFLHHLDDVAVEATAKAGI